MQPLDNFSAMHKTFPTPRPNGKINVFAGKNKTKRQPQLASLLEEDQVVDTENIKSY